MKDLDQGMLKLLGPLAGEANRLLGYDRDGVAVALNPVDSKIYEVLELLITQQQCSRCGIVGK